MEQAHRVPGRAAEETLSGLYRDLLIALLQEWSTHMHAAVTEGRIPDSFKATLDFWQDRNITRFHEPKKSGDDCHETAATQAGYLKAAGFRDVQLVWSAKLWGVLVGRKLPN